MNDNNNPDIVLEETKDGFEWIDLGGKRRKFSPAIRTLRLKLIDLQLCFAASYFDEKEDPFERALVTTLRGNASIDDMAIEIVGDPDSRSNAISVSIVAANEERREWAMRDSQEGIIRQTVLGYNKYDWEIGLDSEWFLEISLSVEQMNDLVSSVRDRSVSAVTVGVESPKLYVEEWYAPPAARINWFIRPERGLVHGRVVSLDIRRTPIKLAPAEEITTYRDDEGGKPTHSLPSTSPDISVSIDRLSEKVGKLTKYVGWLAIFVLGIAVSLLR